MYSETNAQLWPYILTKLMHNFGHTYAPIIVTPHLPQVGHGWGLLGICKSRLTNSPPLGPILRCKSPTFCIGTSKNDEDSWINAPTLGTKYTDKSLQIPTRCPTWGRWGLTMIGALYWLNFGHTYQCMAMAARLTMTQGLSHLCELH